MTKMILSKRNPLYRKINNVLCFAIMIHLLSLRFYAVTAVICMAVCYGTWHPAVEDMRAAWRKGL